MQSDYSQGLVCTSCGTPRSNKSKALCRACYYRISGRENRQQTVLGHATRWAKRIFPGVNSGCTHHWIYPPPNGPTSIGWCRICGAHDESATASIRMLCFSPQSEGNRNAQPMEYRPCVSPLGQFRCSSQRFRVSG